VVEDGGKSEKKGGEERCGLEELGLAGEVVGAGALVGALVEVGVEAGLGGVVHMLGVGLAMACLMVILIEDTDLVTHTMVTLRHRPMATTHTKGAYRLRMFDNQFRRFSKERLFNNVVAQLIGRLCLINQATTEFGGEKLPG